MREKKLIVFAALLIAANAYTRDYGDSYATCERARSTSKCTPSQRYSGYRTVEGNCNNLKFTTWGATKIPFRREIHAEYVDKYKYDVPRGYPGFQPKLEPANKVSQELFQVEKETKGSRKHLSTLFMTFGQFVDHDITDTLVDRCTEKGCGQTVAFRYPCFAILFDDGDFTRCTPFSRSRAVCLETKRGVREQMNILSSFVDASQIYGDTVKHFVELRKMDGSGELKIKKEGLLEEDPSIKNCQTIGGCSLVGDHRGDENIALHSMHTLWVREHNRIAKELKKMNAHWNEEKTFQTARKITSAVWQHIVFREWLPLVTGTLRYKGYRNRVNPGLSNAFSTAAFRFGHSLIPNSFALLDKSFNKLHKSVTVQESFNNRQLGKDLGIETFMFGLAGNKSNEVDTGFAFSIARRLFVTPGKDEYHDLTARNIQRGRDHGLPSYGAYRKWCKLPAIKTWAALKRHMPTKAVHAFKKLYKSPYDIDLFAGGIAESHGRYQVVGPTFKCIIRRQFYRLQHGDRFYYRAPGIFNRRQRLAIFRTRMSTILCNNLKGIVSIQKHAFFTSSGRRNRRRECKYQIPKLNLNPWRERRRGWKVRPRFEIGTRKQQQDEASKRSAALNDLDEEELGVSPRSQEKDQASSSIEVNGLIKEPGYDPEAEEELAFIKPLDGPGDDDVKDDVYEKKSADLESKRSSGESAGSALNEYNLDPKVEVEERAEDESMESKEKKETVSRSVIQKPDADQIWT